MVVKILGSSAGFSGVRYNHEKMRSGKGELLKVKNFGALMALEKLGPQDYINYLQSVSAINNRISKPQFHAVISAKGKSVSKYELLGVGEKWMDKMGYGDSPYLVIFHSDTDNNHIHMVSSRVDKSGRKISSTFEKIRAVRHMSAICGLEMDGTEKLENLLGYTFSTLAQLRTLLEKSGFEIRSGNATMQVWRSGGLVKELKVAELERLTGNYRPDEKRLVQLRAILKRILNAEGLREGLSSSATDLGSRLEYLSSHIRRRSGAELVFHAREGKPPYGYTIIDHAGRSVVKGSEVMPLREILAVLPGEDEPMSIAADFKISHADPAVEVNHILFSVGEGYDLSDFSQPLDLQEDIDDEAINGRNRQRKGKARTNTR